MLIGCFAASKYKLNICIWYDICIKWNTSEFISAQEHLSELTRKYEHAKKVIHELQRHEQFLAVQLQERDYEYNSHLGILRDRVLQLENELATTQKYAGIPVQLPYEKPLLNGELSPPELLKQPPVR